MIITAQMNETVKFVFERWMRAARVEEPRNLANHHIQRREVKMMYRHQLATFFAECDFHVPRAKIEQLINENIEEFSEVDESVPVQGEFLENDEFTSCPEHKKKNRFTLEDCQFLYILLMNSVTVEDARDELHEMYQKTLDDGRHMCYKRDFRKECETGDVPARPDQLLVLDNIMKYCEWKENPEYFDADMYFAIVTTTAGVDCVLPNGTVLKPEDFKMFYEGYKEPGLLVDSVECQPVQGVKA